MASRPSPFEAARQKMIERDLVRRGIVDPRVLEAMDKVPREAFVADDRAGEAYEDGPLPIGFGQTISQPYIVAAMAQAARIPADGRVLDVGTGSGYAAAVYAELAREVFSVERIPGLSELAATNLRKAGFDERRVHLRVGDGALGWPEAAPFSAILVAASDGEPPDPLLSQLAIGGSLVLPVRHGTEEILEAWRRRSAVRYEREELFPVRFVPLVRG